MWDDNYRLLSCGEIIRAGDEVDICRDGWRDESKWELVKNCIGAAAPDPLCPSHRRYRRLVKLEHKATSTCFCRPVEIEPGLYLHKELN